jgi:hypothetical protein
MILTSVFESIKRECFPFPRGLVVGHCSVGDAGRDNTPTEILDAPEINATKILDALEHTFTEILNAPGINVTKILDALEHIPTKILDAPGINATKILDALKHTFTKILDTFRQNATKILNARSRTTQAQTNPVQSQILNAINQITPRAKL